MKETEYTGSGQQEASNGPEESYLLDLINDPQSQRIFSSDVKKAKGRALVVVHPFFAKYDYKKGKLYQDDDNYRKLYDQYEERLRRTIDRYRQAEIPIVFFEGQTEVPRLKATLATWEQERKMAYLVETDWGSSVPLGFERRDMYDFIDDLHRAGLERAVAAGSFLSCVGGVYLRDKDINTWGCVGSLLTRFKSRGIKTTPGHAVFREANEFKNDIWKNGELVKDVSKISVAA